jgi:hypothetical protein
MAEARPEPRWLLLELAGLEEEERELSATRRRLHDQIDRGFANPLLLARERQISAERRELHRRIDVLIAQLVHLNARNE